MTFIFLIFVAMTLMLGSNGKSTMENNWGYHTGKSFSSPYHWKDLPGTSCGGKRQSPVNIDKVKLLYRNDLKPVTVSRRKIKTMVSLTTHPTSIYLQFSDSWTLSFGGEGCYKPITIHWHWGLKDNQGSEHTINGVQFDMEGHLVTYNCHLYNNSDDALKFDNGLFVFSMLYKIGDMNPTLGKLIPLISTVVNSGSASLNEIPPVQFLPQDRGSYYRYEGSLTTPPCTENVVWTIFRDIQTLSEYQLYKFRSLQFGAPESGSMGDNFRPVQPLIVPNENINRIVWASFNSSFVHSCSLCFTAFLLILTLLYSYE